MRLVEGYAAIGEFDEVGTRLKPQSVQYGARFLLGFDAKSGCIEQCIQIIQSGCACTNVQCRSRPIKLNEPIKADLRG